MKIDLEVTLEFKGKEYKIINLQRDIDSEYISEYGIEDYWWEEGNGECDCNRSLMSTIAKEYPELCRDGDNAFPCGDTINLVSIKQLTTPTNEKI